MELRPYQNEALSGLRAAWKQNPSCRPVIVAPTGSGKSLILSELCRLWLKKNPNDQILVLAHRKELIGQNASELHGLLQEPIGVWSAGLRQKTMRRVTCANIQSIYKVKIEADLVIIDEVHLFSGKDDSMYGKLLDRLKMAKVVGLTATPYRLDQGSLVGGFFNEIAYNISVIDLIQQDYLCSVTSQAGKAVDMTGVRKSGIDYNEKEMAQRFSPLVIEHCKQLQQLDRKHILIFASDISHVIEVATYLGEEATYVTSELMDFERDRRIAEFKMGRYKYLVNCQILTTGFNHPPIDCIALLRATKSTSLYVQIVGRGMRISENKEDCLVLDFGDNIKTHGPIDCIELKRKKDGGIAVGIAPTRTCPKCGCVWGIKKAVCRCGYEFPVIVEPPTLNREASNIPILSSIVELRVKYFTIKIHTKEQTSLMIIFTCIQADETERKVFEFLPFNGKGINFAINKWRMYAKTSSPRTTEEAFERKTEIKSLSKIRVKKEGQYDRVLSVEFKPEVEFVLEENEYNL